MKHLLLLSALVVIGALQSFAQSFKEGGIAYKVYDAGNSYVEVTEGSTNAFGHYTIPGYVSHDDVRYKVKRIGEYAFFNVAGAFDITIEEGVTEVQQFAISYCPNLTAVNLPTTLRTLGQSCLSRNEKLPAITLPEGLTTVEKFALMGCTSLKSVTLPSTLTTINKEAFRECGITDIYCHATNAPWVNPNAFDDASEIILHVLPGCADSYAADATWGKCEIVEDLGVAPEAIASNGISAPAAPIYDLSGKAVSANRAKTPALLITNGRKVVR